MVAGRTAQIAPQHTRSRNPIEMPPPVSPFESLALSHSAAAAAPHADHPCLVFLTVASSLSLPRCPNRTSHTHRCVGALPSSLRSSCHRLLLLILLRAAASTSPLCVVAFPFPVKPPLPPPPRVLLRGRLLPCVVTPCLGTAGSDRAVDRDGLIRPLPPSSPASQPSPLHSPALLRPLIAIASPGHSLPFSVLPCQNLS